MIKVEKIDVWGFEHAIRGARNPLNSWDKNDSKFIVNGKGELEVKIGEKDLNLMKRLFDAGTEHRKYLRQIAVSMDITAPLYWWKQFDTYRVGVTVNSTSTMHKIAAKEFTVGDFSFENVTGADEHDGLERIVSLLNDNRNRFLETKDKKYWWNMIQLLPSSYNQKRTVTMNYENVITMIRQRSGHKLDEWNEFIKTLKNLPYIKELLGDEA